MRKPSRFPFRLFVIVLWLLRLPFHWYRRRPTTIRNVLILHHLLLGDTLMVTPLLAKLRECYPDARLAMTVPYAYLALYASAPYGVEAIPFDPRILRTLWKLWRHPRADLVVLPADNRYSWLARALGARWIVAFASDKPAYKNWPVDELRPYSDKPTSFSDTCTELIDGPPPRPYQPSDWPAPPYTAIRIPPTPYCVLHLGASSPLKQWPSTRWRELAQWLTTHGYTVVWSAGIKETTLVDAADPEHTWYSTAGQLDLAQLWQLLSHAALLVSPDTGIAHLGRITGVPTITLFGPGSSLLCGAGEFWRNTHYYALTAEAFPCRDQTIQFFRSIPWVRRCERLPGQPPHGCQHARCMDAVSITHVITAIKACLYHSSKI